MLALAPRVYSSGAGNRLFVSARQHLQAALVTLQDEMHARICFCNNSSVTAARCSLVPDLILISTKRNALSTNCVVASWKSQCHPKSMPK